MWSVSFADRAGPPWGWKRVARSSALWMESCLEVASTTKGDGLSGIVPLVHFENGSPTMGDRIIPTKRVGNFAPKVVPMANARRGQRRPEIFEGVDDILRKKEPHIGIGSCELSVFKEVRATVWGSAEYLGPVVESVIPKGDKCLQDERGLGKLLGVQWALVLVHLDGDPRGEAGRNMVPLPDFWIPFWIGCPLMGGLPCFSQLSRGRAEIHSYGSGRPILMVNDGI